MPLLKLRLAAPAAVVDIGRIPELRGIARQGDHIRIGALTTHAELAASADLRVGSAGARPRRRRWSAIPPVRNRGTIGGNVAHADPASDLPTVLVALDARFVAAGPKGERTIAADEFFTGIMTTALAEDEILTAVEVPASAAGQGSAYEKFSHPGVALRGDRRRGRRHGEGRHVHGGARCDRRPAAGARRAPRGRAALTGTAGDRRHDCRRGGGRWPRDLGDDVTGDIYASAEYRARDGAGLRQARARGRGDARSVKPADGPRDLYACR